MPRRQVRSLKDSLIKPQANPKQRVTLIQNGMKYKAGQKPVRVCPTRPNPQTIAKLV